MLEVKKEMEYELGNGEPLRQFTAWPIILAGWAASMLGDTEGGLKEVERGLLIYRDQGSSLVLPSFNSIHGECLLRARLPLRAREVIDSALADSRARDQRYAESQLLRLRGLTLLDASDSVESREEAMSSFVAAESIASSQGARGFQLRAATSILEFATGDQMISAYHKLISLLATFRKVTTHMTTSPPQH